MKYRFVRLFVVLLALTVFAVSALAEGLVIEWEGMEYEDESYAEYEALIGSPEAISNSEKAVSSSVYNGGNIEGDHYSCDIFNGVLYRFSVYKENGDDIEHYEVPWPSSRDYDGYVVEHFSIPEGVTEIRPSAFLGAPVKSISLPSTLTTIGDNAFLRTLIEEITIPGAVKSIGYRAFCDNRFLKRATIMNGVETLGEEIFSECDALEQVSIPATVQSIGKKAFMGCYRLSSVELVEGLSVMGEDMFWSCSIAPPIKT